MRGAPSRKESELKRKMTHQPSFARRGTIGAGLLRRATKPVELPPEIDDLEVEDVKLDEETKVEPPKIEEDLEEDAASVTDSEVSEEEKLDNVGELGGTRKDERRVTLDDSPEVKNETDSPTQAQDVDQEVQELQKKSKKKRKKQRVRIPLRPFQAPATVVDLTADTGYDLY